ncbi:MAG TPA: hypothetical protein VIJ93_04260 [bacterium]
MKKLLAVGLVMFFVAASSGMALADGTACAGKCKGHHGHKKGSKTQNSGTLNNSVNTSK